MADHRRRVLGVVGLVVAAGLAPVVGGSAQAAGITPVLVWQRTFPGVTFRESSPAPAQLATPAYVVGGLDGRVYAFDAATGNDEPGWPVATSDPVDSSPAAADVVGGGKDNVFVGSGEPATTVAAACSGGGTYSFASDGSTVWHNIGSDPDCANQAFFSSFTIGPTLGGSALQATVGALGLQAPSYNAASGVMNGGWPYYTDDTVFSSPAQQDVNGDGVPDIIMGGDATAGPGSFRGGMMRALSGSGKVIWQFNTDEQVRSSPAVGDITGTGTPSIVFGTGNFWLTHGGAVDSTYLFSLNLHGSLLWKVNLGGVTQASPALSDVNGTGQVDVVEGTSGTPAAPNTGAIWVLDGTGRALPQWAGVPSPGGVIIGGISTADLNGDGSQDLLVPTGAGVYLYDGRTAALLGGLDIGKVGFQNTPLVTDDGGGSVGITVAGTQPDGTGVVQHWRVNGGSVGSLGWPMFRHDKAHTGNLASPSSGLVCMPSASSLAAGGRVARISGANRDLTAVAISKVSFPSAGSARAVVLASDANYPDALAGTPLAYAKHGPLLITAPGGLNGAVLAEIKRVLPLAGTVYILGGRAALSTSIDGQLLLAGYLPDRISGPDRFATAVAIAGALGDPATVFLVTGLGFPDALAAGAAAASAGGAVLLTNGSVQHPTTAAYLAAYGTGARYAVGGPAAVADPTAVALVGPDRYATAALVASRFFPDPAVVSFASGGGFADALAGGPPSAAVGAPILLVPACGGVQTSVTSYLAGVRAGVSAAVLFGGPLAVGDDVLGQLDGALAG